MKKMALIPYEQFINSKQTQNIGKESEQIDENTPEKMDKDLILIPFGKRHLKHASTLLSYVERNMNWNQNGEIIIDQKVIPGSHITDLLKDAMYPYKNFSPLGYDLFYQNLSSVPLSLIRNPIRKTLVGRPTQYLMGRGSENQTIPPPPGLPLSQTPIPIPNTVNDWKASWKTI